MKFVIQRVKNASVTVDNQLVDEIHQGFLVLIGVSNSDTKEIADKLGISRSYVSRIEKRALE